MSTVIRKCISLAPFTPNPDGTSSSEQDLRNRIDEIRATGTRWVKIWARWDQINSFKTSNWTTIGDFATNPQGARWLKALDQQVALARGQAQPIGVIIASLGCPGWANGTAGVAENDPRWDRDRFSGGKRKQLFYRFPNGDQLGVNGAWGDWLKFIINRYAKYGCGVALEVINEPNLQMWPQLNDSGDRTAGCITAQMMITAQATSAGIKPTAHPIMIAGPATADKLGGGGWIHTPHGQFTQDVLSSLASSNFVANGNFIWTNHNYQDIGAANAANAVNARNLLTGYGWAGWHGERADVPNMWHTEGGWQLIPGGDPTADRNTQATRMLQAWQRLGGYSGDSAGMEMLTNYLHYDTGEPFPQGYGTGLRDSLAQGGAVRPLYSTFSSWPGRA